jgi:hypothetical protein
MCYNLCIYLLSKLDYIQLTTLLPEKQIVAQLVKSALLLWNLKLLYCVHKLATGSYPEPDESHPHPQQEEMQEMCSNE